MILLTGASGYVGGRLLHALIARGHQVRCLARRPEILRARVDEEVEIVRGDVLDKDSLKRALDGIETAYYLVHSMGTRGAFEDEDRRGARNFAEACVLRGVRRIVYLGGLGDEDEDLSAHLRSRHEVGRILRESGTQVIELRASIVIGSGSLSFELVRALVERLPVLIMPRWVSVPAQPIAIDDLLDYLVAAIELPSGESRVFEVGGADVVSYGDLMRIYARLRGLRRLMIPVPVLTPFLSSLWLGLVTPVYARIGRKLIESIVHPTVVRDFAARDTFEIEPVGVAEAMRRALAHEEEQFATTRWSDALSSAGPLRTWAGARFGPRLVDSRTLVVPVTPDRAFAPIQRIGGQTGWYAWNTLWRVRGALDLVLGGPGLRRGRPDPVRLRVGDTVDFWRVEAIEPGHRLRLQAEMRLPGRAWLEFETNAHERGAIIRQTAIFDPVGLSGRLYWYALGPFHQLVFGAMLSAIARRAVEGPSSEDGEDH